MLLLASSLSEGTVGTRWPGRECLASLGHLCKADDDESVPCKYRRVTFGNDTVVGARGAVRRSWIAGGTSRWTRRLHRQRENCRQGSQGSRAGSSVGKLSGPGDAPEINRTSPRPAGVMPWEWLAGAVPASSPLPLGAAVAEIVLWTGTWVLSGVQVLYQVSMGVAVESDALEDDP